MIVAGLYRVVTIGGEGVRSASRNGIVIPEVCPYDEAAILYLGEARRLAKWAKSWGIDATYKLYKKHQVNSIPRLVLPVL